MSCDRSRAMLGAPRGDAARAAHLVACAECSAAFERLEELRHPLAQWPGREPGAEAFQRAWTRLGRGEQRRFELWAWAVALGVCALVVLVFFATARAPQAPLLAQRSEAPPPPTVLPAPGEPVRAQPPEPAEQVAQRWLGPAQVRQHGMQAQLSSGAELLLHPLADGTERWELRSGELRVAYTAPSAGALLELQTPTGRLSVQAGRFVLRAAAERTEVRVEQGELNLWPQGQRLPRAVFAGQSASSGAPPPPPAQRPRAAPRAAPAPEQSAPAVEPAPQPVEQSAGALLARADQARRAGQARDAAELYHRLGARADAALYAEEAALQEALLLAELEERAGALRVLAEARARFPSGPTAPERVALEAQVELSAGQPQRAAAVLASAPRVLSAPLCRARLDVARALPEDRALARSLLTPLLEGSAPEELRAEARALLARFEDR